MPLPIDADALKAALTAFGKDRIWGHGTHRVHLTVSGGCGR